MAVTGDATYTATYTESARVYTVTLDLNGGKLASGWTAEFTYTVGEGAKLPIHENDGISRTGYNCFNWKVAGAEGTLTAISKSQTGDLTLTANWTPKAENTYEVELRDNATGKVVAPRRIDKSTSCGNKYGKVIHPSVAYDTGVYPEYNSEKLTIKVWNTLNVNKMDYTHGEGSGADYYEFVGSRMEPAGKGTNHYLIYGDVHYFHTVTFVDYNGNVIETMAVEHGTAATAPQNPTRKGYVFTGWDNEFSEVTSSMTITAQYDYQYLKDAKLKINVGNGTPASGSSKGNVESHWGKIYNVRSYYSYYDYPNYKTDSIMDLGDFDFARTHAEAIPGDVTYEGVAFTNGTDEITSNDFYKLTGEFAYVACKAQYHLDYKASFYHTVKLVLGTDADGNEISETLYVIRGEKLDTTEIADQLVKAGFNMAGWITEDGEEFDVETAVKKSMTLTANWEVIKLDEWKMTVHVSTDSDNDYLSREGWTFVNNRGKMYNVNHYASYGAQFALVGEDDYDYTDAQVGNIVLDGTYYTYAADLENPPMGDFYVIDDYAIITQNHSNPDFAKYMLRAHITLYHTVIFNVQGEWYTVVVKHGETADTSSFAKKLSFYDYQHEFDAEFGNVTKSMLINVTWTKP